MSETQNDLMRFSNNAANGKPYAIGHWPGTPAHPGK